MLRNSPARRAVGHCGSKTHSWQMWVQILALPFTCADVWPSSYEGRIPIMPQWVRELSQSPSTSSWYPWTWPIGCLNWPTQSFFKINQPVLKSSGIFHTNSDFCLLLGRIKQDWEHWLEPWHRCPLYPGRRGRSALQLPIPHPHRNLRVGSSGHIASHITVGLVVENYCSAPMCPPRWESNIQATEEDLDDPTSSCMLCTIFAHDVIFLGRIWVYKHSYK